MDAALRRILLGTDEPVPEPLELAAGPLTLRLCGTRLLAMHAGGHEVWHGAAFLHRDADWGTAEPVVDRIDLDIAPHGFHIRIAAHVPTQPGIDLVIEIDGSSDGEVRYAGAATPRGDSATNRTGLCLMHPMAAAGLRIEVGHVDGRTSASTLPRLIAPWPPFTGIRSIRHEYAPGAWAEAEFDGDVFEFEDQRNNADASYKTYNRSNLMPRPYLLRAGESVRQSVRLRLLPTTTEPLQEPARPAAVWPRAAGMHKSPFPPLAIAIDALPADVEATLPMLARLAPALLHLTLDDPAQRVDWPRIAALLAAAGARLRIDVAQLDAAGAGNALERLAAAMAGAGIEPASVAVFPSTPPVIAAARSVFVRAAIGGGTPHFFTQLNRTEDLGAVDFLTFTTGALVHGADDESVMLGLASLPSMLETLAVSRPGLPVEVGPSAIGSRHSPLGRQPPSHGTRRLALARHDPRSRALFGAAWLVGHLAQFAGAGAQMISLLGLAGPSGLLRGEMEGVQPCPAFFVLERLRGAARLQHAGLSACGRFAVIAFESDAGDALSIIANLGADADCELPPDMPQPSARAVQLMDAVAWQAFLEGHLPGPWRDVNGPDAACMPAYGVMLQG